MARKRHTQEQVISKLREAEVAIAEGNTVAESARRIGVTKHIFYHRRSEYGGLRIDQAGRLKRLESKNIRLQGAVADLTLDNQILREASEGNLWALRVVAVVDHVKALFGVSERCACRAPGHPRSAQRYGPGPEEDEKALTEEIVELACQFGR